VPPRGCRHPDDERTQALCCPHRGLQRTSTASLDGAYRLFGCSGVKEKAVRLARIRLPPSKVPAADAALQTADYSNIAFLEPPLRGRSELFAVAFSPNGRWVAAGSLGRVLLWDRQLPDKAVELTGPKNYVYAVAFSNDSQFLACGSEDRGVRVWDLRSRELLWGPSPRGNDHRHADAVYSVAFSPDGRELVSGGYDRKVMRWSVDGGQLQGNQPSAMNGIGRVSSVAFSPDGKTVAVGSHDNSVWLWTVATGEAQQLVGHTGPGAEAGATSGHRALEAAHASSVEGVAFSGDGRLLASCGLDKVVRIWDLATRLQIRRCLGHDYLVRSVAFSPDNATVASASWDKTLRIWDAMSGRELRTMKSESIEPWHTDWIWSVAFAPDGLVLASAGSDQRVLLWKIGAARGKVDNSGLKTAA
jgi:WD40 repeat protein